MLRKTYRSVRCSLVRETATEPYEQPATVRNGGCVARLVRTLIADDPRECFVAVLLDTRHKVIGVHEVSIGVADSAPVHPREVFTAAVGLAATAVVVAHNHPSGDCKPSPEDRGVTDRLNSAGDLLGIQVLDHVVVSDGAYYSLAEEQRFTFEDIQ